MARCMAMAGVKPGMVVHNAYGYGLFTGGLGFHQGAERLGALDDPGLRRRHRAPGDAAARPRRARCCAARPSYALHIAQGLREAGIGPDDLALEIGMFGAEPWTEAMRDAARGRARPDGAEHLRPVGDRRPGRRRRVPRGPRRPARAGGPLPGRGRSTPRPASRVPDGTDGELVFTTLTKEAMPLLRYRTGDIASLTREPLRVRADVRAHERRPRPPRRHADHPRRQPLPVARSSTSCCASDGRRAALPARRRAPATLDEVTVHCEPARRRRPIALADRVQQRRSASRSASPSPSSVRAPGEVPRSEGKAVRVIDRRARS